MKLTKPSTKYNDTTIRRTPSWRHHHQTHLWEKQQPHDLHVQPSRSLKRKGAANQSINICYHRYPCTLCIYIKAQMTTMHGDGSTPILRNDCESYLQMRRIKGAFLISRYTAGQDWHGCTNLLLCTESEVVLSNKLFDVSSFQLCNYDYAHIILHLHVTHSSSQYHDNCP